VVVKIWGKYRQCEWVKEGERGEDEVCVPIYELFLYVFLLCMASIYILPNIMQYCRHLSCSSIYPQHRLPLSSLCHLNWYAWLYIFNGWGQQMTVIKFCRRRWARNVIGVWKQEITMQTIEMKTKTTARWKSKMFQEWISDTIHLWVFRK
jgi:hypothetical protein